MSTRNLGLDLLRGSCALGIVFYHFKTWQHIALTGQNPVLYESLGRFGVYVFFALSALVLSMLYSRDFSNVISRSSLISFYQKRAIRILPLLAFTATLVLIYKSTTSGFSYALFTRHVFTSTGLFSLGLPGLLSNGAVAWSLGIELLFYLLFPIIGMILFSWSSRKKTLVLLVLVALDLLYLNFLYRGFRNDSLHYWRYFMTLFTFSPFFLIGFMVHSSKLYLKPILFPLALVFFFVIALWSEVVGLNIDQDVFKPLSFCLLTASVYGVTYCCWHMHLPKALHLLARWLGEVSYALYLSHWIAYLPIKHEVLTMSLGVYLLLSLVLAFIINRLFEVPVKTWLNKFLVRSS